MLESSIERDFVRHCRAHNAVCLKQNALWYVNIPDRLVALPGGLCFFIELKRPGETPRPGQEKRLRWLRRNGHRAYYADTLAKAIDIFDQEMKRASEY